MRHHHELLRTLVLLLQRLGRGTPARLVCDAWADRSQVAARREADEGGAAQEHGDRVKAVHQHLRGDGVPRWWQ